VAHFFGDVFAGVLAGGLFVIAAGVRGLRGQEAIIWSLGLAVPILAAWGRRATAKRR